MCIQQFYISNDVSDVHTMSVVIFLTVIVLLILPFLAGLFALEYGAAPTTNICHMEPANSQEIRVAQSNSKNSPKFDLRE